MDLRQYFKIVLRWWWLILLSTSIAAVASYVASSQQPRIYQASTTLMVGQVIQEANPSAQDFFTTERLAESYSQMARRQPILQATIDSLGLKMSWQSLKGRVYAQQTERTQLLVVSVSDTSPERARIIADEIGRQLILQSPTSPKNQARQDRGAFVQSQLDDLETRIETAQARVRELEAKLTTAFSAREIQELQTEIGNLESLIRDWQGNYAELLNFLEGGDSPNYLSVIEPAQLPTRPISPQVERNVLLAAAVGFMLAAGAALLLEYIDDTIKSADDFAERLGLTSLGSIGRMDGKDYRERLITSEDSTFSPVSEAYRVIRSNIQFMAVDEPAKSIMVTSANPGEGKSTTAANLALIMAQADLKTILVDADLRKPVMHKIFGVPNLGGLTDLLRSPEMEIDGHLKSTEIENLKLITSGPLPPNPAEILSSKRMAQLLPRLEEIADVIIFDSPPVLPVTDAVALSTRVDGVVLVTRAGQTRRELISRALQNLKQVRANVLGAVLNGISQKATAADHYHYYARSGQKAQTQRSFAKPRRWWQRVPLLK